MAQSPVAPPAGSASPASPGSPGITSDALPPVATTKEELKKKLAEGQSKININKGSEKASHIVDKAIDSMKSTWVKLDEQVADDSCWKRVTKALRDVHDPVQSARCSMGRLGFFLLTMTGAVFAIIEASLYDSIADLGAGILMFLLGLFVTVCLGGDIFMFEAFRRIVDGLAWQIEVLKASRLFYQNKLEDLKDVAEGLEKVQGQMSGDIDATTKLLSDMERLGKLRTVTSVVNMFHNADFDGSGCIKGEAAELFIPEITILWQIVPGYDKSKVIEHVRQNGMTLRQFYPILDALVEENEALAFKALEDLLGETGSEIAEGLVPNEDEIPQDSEAQQKPAVQLESAEMHTLAPVEEDWDVEAAASPVPRMMQETMHSMAPPTPTGEKKGVAGKFSGRSLNSNASKDVPGMLKPLFTVPTPVPKKKIWGVVEVGGSCSVWGIWHLGALICVPISILIFIFCIVEGEIHNIILACVLVCFTLALTGTGKLIEILKALRWQLREFTSENLKLRELNDTLAVQVAKLQKLKDGWMQLQTLCSGNVEKAKEILEKSNTKSKMEAVGVVTRLFRMNTDSQKLTLTEAHKEAFFVDLQKLFQNLPGFDIAKIKDIVGPGDMGHQKIREIVDVIVSFETEQPPAKTL